jgi:transposase
MRTVRHESLGSRRLILKFHGHKFYCKTCQRYFNQSFPSVKPYQRATERLKDQVFRQHTQGISQKDLAQEFRVGKSTIERWFHQCYLRENQHIKGRDCPQVLGIDEHFFSKKHGFATTFCDLRKHRIFDVVLGRAQQDLAGYLATLPGKDKVKVVCIDLSSTYRSLIKLHFPNAKIVADRFHVIRLINQMALQTYQSIDPEIKWNRGILAMLRTNPENLSEKQILKRDEYLKYQPLIKEIYGFKQRLHRLLMIKKQRAEQCKNLIPLFLNKIKQLKETALKPLQTLGRSLYHWREEIVRMWRFTKNNGITEGFHRKMKLIQRRAYGFRNFENYRMRVRVLCG